MSNMGLPGWQRRSRRLTWCAGFGRAHARSLRTIARELILIIEIGEDDVQGTLGKPLATHHGIASAASWFVANLSGRSFSRPLRAIPSIESNTAMPWRRSSRTRHGLGSTS